MKSPEETLEARLGSLPDVYPDFAWCTMLILKKYGLVEEALRMLEETPEATTGTVESFQCIYRGVMREFNSRGKRVPVDAGRLRFTSGMREIMAQMKGKTLKFYEVALGDAEALVANGDVRIGLGQHVIDLSCFDNLFEIEGNQIGLSQFICARRSRLDEFMPYAPELRSRAYAVGERITGVELVTERVAAEIDGGPCEFDVDVAVAVRTAHAVYTFARESWRSTGICVSVADDVAIPYEVGECDASWLGAAPGAAASVVEVARKATRLA